MISRWCFRHLVDPLGTFVQAYNLLRRILVIDGFLFNTNISYENGAMIDLFVRTKAPFLMQSYDSGHSLNRFILVRHDETPCQLDFGYTDVSEKIDTSYQIGSCCITGFYANTKYADIDYFICSDSDCYESNRLYGDKNLYNWLRKNRIIEPFMKWSKAKNDTVDRFRLHSAATSGDLIVLKQLLEDGEDIDEPDSGGFTAFHLAMKNQKMECFQYLLQAGADCTIFSCDTRKIFYRNYDEKMREKDITLIWEAEKQSYDPAYIEMLKDRLSHFELKPSTRSIVN